MDFKKRWMQFCEHRLYYKLGYALIKNADYVLWKKNSSYLLNINENAEFMGLHERCNPFTKTGIVKMYGMYEAVCYIVNNGIEGDIVECGVFKGGAMMAAALQLKQLGQTDKRIYLYDTFEGMSEPSAYDLVFGADVPAKVVWDKIQRKKADGIPLTSGEEGFMCLAALDEVKANMASTGYPADSLVFVKGKVEDTIPSTVPKQIALLRLDTDFYESTYHELVHLYPRLAPNGVIIFDDYGIWKGSREAADHYFTENNIYLLLNKMETGCIGIKQGQA